METPPVQASSPSPPSSMQPQATAGLPPLAPGQLGDREKLMAHISVLSAQIARLQLQLSSAASNSSSSGAPPPDPSAFDPAVAEQEIARLNKILAQQSLLQEARENHYKALEGEVEALREERGALLRSNAELQQAETEFHDRMKQMQLHTQHNDQLEEELRYYRDRERELTEELVLARSSDPVVRIVRGGDGGGGGRVGGEHMASHQPQHDSTTRLQRETLDEFQLQVHQSREELLLHMLYEPIADCFAAGARWIMSQARWDEECVVLRQEAQREHEEWLLMQQRQALEQQASAASSQMNNNDNNNSSAMLNEELLTVRSELEAAKQQIIFLQSTNDRLERNVQSERKRLENKSKLFQEAMEKVQEDVVSQRKLFVSELRKEMEMKMKQAFRNGRVYEREKQLAGVTEANRENRENRHLHQRHEPATSEPLSVRNSPAGRSVTVVGDSDNVAPFVPAPTTNATSGATVGGAIATVAAPGAAAVTLDYGTSDDDYHESVAIAEGAKMVAKAMTSVTTAHAVVSTAEKKKRRKNKRSKLAKTKGAAAGSSSSSSMEVSSDSDNTTATDSSTLTAVSDPSPDVDLHKKKHGGSAVRAAPTPLLQEVEVDDDGDVILGSNLQCIEPVSSPHSPAITTGAAAAGSRLMGGGNTRAAPKHPQAWTSGLADAAATLNGAEDNNSSPSPSSASGMSYQPHKMRYTSGRAPSSNAPSSVSGAALDGDDGSHHDRSCGSVGDA